MRQLTHHESKCPSGDIRRAPGGNCRERHPILSVGAGNRGRPGLYLSVRDWQANAAARHGGQARRSFWPDSEAKQKEELTKGDFMPEPLTAKLQDTIRDVVARV